MKNNNLEEILNRKDIPADTKAAIQSKFQQLEFLALHDSMTGLYNRNYYAEKRQNSNLQIGDKPLLAS